MSPMCPRKRIKRIKPLKTYIKFSSLNWFESRWDYQPMITSSGTILPAVLDLFFP